MQDDFLARLAAIVGANQVLTGADAAPFAVSARRVRGDCLAVVRPGTTQEVADVVRLAASCAVPVVPQGGNTGLSDGAVPRGPGVLVLSLSRLNAVLDVDPLNFTMTVQAGVVLAAAQQAASAHGLLLPISLGAEGSCQIGGNLATNAGGKSVLKHGMARACVLGLEVVLPDGTVWNGLKQLRKDNAGYDLKQLFVGAEGTLGTITAAVLALQPAPRTTVTAFVAVPGPAQAIRLLARLRRDSGDCVSAFELMNRYALQVPLAHMPGASRPFDALPAWAVLVELSSCRRDDPLAALLEDALAAAMDAQEVVDAVVAQSQAQALAFWKLRDEGTAFYWKEGGMLLHDPSVPIRSIPDFVERVAQGVEQAASGARVSAFGHIGDGNIHIIVSQPEGADKRAFLALAPAIQQVVYGTAVALGGSFSAEHGIGQLKTAHLARYGDPVALQLMRRLRAALDPRGTMNPRTLFDLQAET
jgi:FAD/FMN-containing dehydrogenase